MWVLSEGYHVDCIRNLKHSRVLSQVVEDQFALDLNIMNRMILIVPVREAIL